MKRLSLLLFILLTPIICDAEVINVTIKGVDDGVKTNRQQDYKEALMNAKLQAIERAGVGIESVTRVVNFQMRYKAVESRSEAVLLPGFQVMDIGYLKDGSYQVVLIGKVRTIERERQELERLKMEVERKKLEAERKRLEAEKKKIAVAKKEIGRDRHFIEYDTGVVYDKKTGLEWVAGSDQQTSWYEAKRWVEDLNIAGGGWRMPTIKELKALYERGAGSRNMTPLLKTSGWYVWSSETVGSSKACFFNFGGFFAAGGREYCEYDRNFPFDITRGFAVRSRR